MAKSIRSKSKRKYRAIKRTKSLKQLGNDLKNITNLDVKLVTLPFVTRAELVTASSEVHTDASGSAQLTKDSDAPMEAPNTVTSEKKPGSFPVWMNKRERKRQIRLYRLRKRRRK
ncbi:uncharacterized protein DEA37_0000364 [Paragonimus westermani]|uniref:Uncharacterized protein n=1 Tax=Paragonimus westermani TaxID=34504 RepID=A0A5J4N4I9_9TREM|nr:uncharacterized protein DEA37_0000364 [Paragonimus westermani]